MLLPYQVKPEYQHSQEIDAVIIGARMGTNRRRGYYAEYLLGLAEAPRAGAIEPSTFVSFCM